MRYTKATFLISAALAIASPSNAEVFKQTMPDGSVVFTDQPVEGQAREKVDLKPVATIPAIDPSSVDYTPPEQTKEEMDFNISINSPSNGKTFRNAEADSISVLVAILPKTSSKHKIKMRIDGQEISPQTRTLPPQNRGEHTLTVEILRGSKVLSSASSTFFVHRYSAKH